MCERVKHPPTGNLNITKSYEPGHGQPDHHTVGQKEKLVVLSNFSFCHGVFKSCLLQMCQNASIGGKGLT